MARIEPSTLNRPSPQQRQEPATQAEDVRWSSATQNHKRSEKKSLPKWVTSIETEGAIREGKPVRNRSNDALARFNPLDTSAGGDADRRWQEAAGDSFHLDVQRRALLRLRSRLHGDVIATADTALSGCGIETSCGSPDSADRAGEIVEQDVAVSLLGSVSGTLEEIDAALQRLDDGSYGRCVECDARIPPARLEAIPYAPCCVHCAARRERAA